MNPLFLLLILVVFLSSCETTSEDVVPGATAAETVLPYPLETCLVTDEPLAGRNDVRTLFHKGQEVKLCCAACQMAFKKDPDLFLAKLP